MIHIKDDYYIDSDAYQFILKQDMHRVDKEGKPVFDLIGYYATVEQALRGYLKTQMRGYASKPDIEIGEALDFFEQMIKELVERCNQDRMLLELEETLRKTEVK